MVVRVQIHHERSPHPTQKQRRFLQIRIIIRDISDVVEDKSELSRMMRPQRRIRAQRDEVEPTRVCNGPSGRPGIDRQAARRRLDGVGEERYGALVLQAVRRVVGGWVVAGGETQGIVVGV